MDPAEIQRNKTEAPVDQLFRQQLDQHRVEPSDRLWGSLQRKLLMREIGRMDFSNLYRKFWFWGAAGMVVVAGLLLFPDDPSTPVDEQNQPEPASSPVMVTQKTSVISLPASPVSTAVSSSPTTPSISAAGQKTSMLTPQSASDQHPVTEPSAVTRVTEAPSFSGTTEGSSMNSFQDYGLLSPVILLNHSLLPIPFVDTLRYFHPGGEVHLVKADSPARSSFFTAGFGISAEYLSYRMGDSKSQEFNYWLNGSLTWHLGRFSLQTGAGVGYLYDEGIYELEYRSNDSIGFFYDVISYAADPLHPEIITYQTVQTNLYDSITHITDDRTRNRYTYIQVPLLVGVDIYTGKTLNLNLSAGPAVSFLTGKKEALPYIDFPNARIIRVDNNTPARLEMNWQLWLKLNMEFRLHRNLGLFIEPSYKYYFNPVVSRENLEVGRPFSLGLNVGIFYHFRMKKEQP